MTDYYNVQPVSKDHIAQVFRRVIEEQEAQIVQEAVNVVVLESARKDARIAELERENTLLRNLLLALDGQA
jgi:cell shape-determining protein MreC